MSRVEPKDRAERLRRLAGPAAFLQRVAQVKVRDGGAGTEPERFPARPCRIAVTALAEIESAQVVEGRGVRRVELDQLPQRPFRRGQVTVLEQQVTEHPTDFAVARSRPERLLQPGPSACRVPPGRGDPALEQASFVPPHAADDQFLRDRQRLVTLALPQSASPSPRHPAR